MKADLTRNTSNPLKHFTRVLMQQGRVQLDADWNEQTAVLLHYLRALAADLIGPHGGPDDSFAVLQAPPIPFDFVIGAGHYYVDGILCEADSIPIPITGFPNSGSKKVKILFWPRDDLAFRSNQYVDVSDGANVISTVQAKITDLDPANRTLTLDPDVSSFSTAKQPRVQRLTTYMTQPDYPVPVGEQLNKNNQNNQYLVYLDVWERLITYVEDDTIREVALDGPDTAARSKVVWQVKITGPLDACLKPEQLNALFQWENRGWLKAMANQASTSADPCIISPDARYRGPENQLYRVEIHRHGTRWDSKGVPRTNDKAATFKWSRENGSAIYPIVTLVVGGGTTTITLENLDRDDRFGLAKDDWVEIVDDDYVLQNSAETLLQVHSVERTNMTVTLIGALQTNVGQDSTKHPLLRRWDHKEGNPAEGGLQLGSDGAALIVEGSGNNWLELEDGVKIQFQQPDKDPQNQYRTGDYWLIPARTATGDVEWPREKDSLGKPIPIAKPPDGVIHHYAPLAVITVSPVGVINLVGQPCRKSFPPMVPPGT